MGEKRYQVFVSSTFRDLEAERARVLRTLAEANYITAGMEFFPAIDEDQLNFIKTIIEDSDYYVIIVAGRYGSTAPDGISYTEKEYDYALEMSLPVIALLKEDFSSLAVEHTESDPAIRASLLRFRERLSAGRLVRYWKDETELCFRLVNSLSVTAKRFPGKGWVRGGGEDPQELLRKIVDLEEENRLIKEEIEDRKKKSVAGLIHDLIESEFIDVRYGIVPIDASDASGDEAEEGKSERQANSNQKEYKVNILELAVYIIPRLRYDMINSKFLEMLGEFVASKTGDGIAYVLPGSLSALQGRLANLGMVSLTTAGPRQFIIRTALGRHVIGDDLVDSFDTAEDRPFTKTREVTVSQFLDDFAVLLGRAAKRVAKGFASFIRRVLSKCRSKKDVDA